MDVGEVPVYSSYIRHIGVVSVALLAWCVSCAVDVEMVMVVEMVLVAVEVVVV